MVTFGAEIIAVVELLERAVKESLLDPKAQQSLLSSLEWLHEESIGQAGWRTASELLTDQEYGGVAPGKYFNECYELRSTIVHWASPQ